MVQWAALKAGHKSRFQDYVLLGDDIVIANGAVASAYLSLLSQFGVQVNRFKSVHAIGGAEFAKRTFTAGEELTKFLTWKTFSEASDGSVDFFSLMKELRLRGYYGNWERILAVVLGPPSPRIVGRSLRNLLLALAEPGGPAEEFNVWRKSSGSNLSVKEWLGLAGGIGILPTLHEVAECPEAAEAQTNDDEHLQLVHASIRLRKAGWYRLQLLGYELSKTLLGHLDYIFAAQLQDTELRLGKRGVKTDKLSYENTSQSRHLLLTLSKVHPARDVLEDGLDPKISSSVPEQLKVLSTSDAETLYFVVDEVRHAEDRRRAALYEIEAAKDLFF